MTKSNTKVAAEGPPKRAAKTAPAVTRKKSAAKAVGKASAAPGRASAVPEILPATVDHPLPSELPAAVIPTETLAQAEAGTIDITFTDLGLSPPMLASLSRAGYTRPTPIQAQAVPLAMKGRDLMGLAQTGTGKTAAFTIPIIERLMNGPKGTRALILTPTRELCQQVEASFARYGEGTGLAVVSVYGGVGYDIQLKALREGVDVIVATPGRLIDHIEKQNVVFDDLEVLVLDEADRMLDMGFAPQLAKIVAAAERRPTCTTTGFRRYFRASASTSGGIVAEKSSVCRYGCSAATTVRHFVYPVPKAKKTELLTHLLKDLVAADSILVFTRTKHGADRVVQHLLDAGFKADALHADKTQVQREQALARFKDGKVQVLVATDIAQRGLDISGISHVVNYDVPQQAEDYVHRIGRTGRAASEGDAFTFMSADEIGMVRTIERVIGQEIPRISIPGYDFGT